MAYVINTTLMKNERKRTMKKKYRFADLKKKKTIISNDEYEISSYKISFCFVSSCCQITDDEQKKNNQLLNNNSNDSESKTKKKKMLPPI